MKKFFVLFFGLLLISISLKAFDPIRISIVSTTSTSANLVVDVLNSDGTSKATIIPTTSMTPDASHVISLVLNTTTWNSYSYSANDLLRITFGGVVLSIERMEVVIAKQSLYGATISPEEIDQTENFTFKKIGILESGTTPTYYTYLQGGDQTVASDITYTLPTAAPTSNGQVLSSTTAGSLSWTIPAAGSATGTVTSVSVVTANGVSGSVTTAATTPAITLTLGAITPTSVVATGTVTGSNLSGSNTGDQDGSETKVNAGTNVTVTGVGTAASPYVVNTVPAFITQVQRDALTPVAGLMVYNTTTNKPNIYNGTEWVNYDGTSAKTLAIGVSYQGGVIAYIFQSGDPGYVAGQIHGLIAAPSDQSTPASNAATWGCWGTTISGADGTAIGTGAQNTIDIVAGCATVGIAARVCSDLVLGGYSDWYLPSKDELNQLYLNKVAVGGFASNSQYWDNYWSSSEYLPNNGYAWSQDFYDGLQNGESKLATQDTYVRAIRAF